ncbi:hypothetical protein AVEN_40319-1 [Araneus ventricosus]|uniref:Uncharacterized protein n=1 Tax=Araneus ventricosus TaxID=182803 RepID=A0A4Y2UXY1_ARAVE|nr:hypothetical protein AVEN_40319-1 [Araneus ventricosus]
MFKKIQALPAPPTMETGGQPPALHSSLGAYLGARRNLYAQDYPRTVTTLTPNPRSDPSLDPLSRPQPSGLGYRRLIHWDRNYPSKGSPRTAKTWG